MKKFFASILFAFALTGFSFGQYYVLPFLNDDEILMYRNHFFYNKKLMNHSGEIVSNGFTANDWNDIKKVISTNKIADKELIIRVLQMTNNTFKPIFI